MQLFYSSGRSYRPWPENLPDFRLDNKSVLSSVHVEGGPKPDVPSIEKGTLAPCGHRDRGLDNECRYFCSAVNRLERGRTLRRVDSALPLDRRSRIRAVQRRRLVLRPARADDFRLRQDLPGDEASTESADREVPSDGHDDVGGGSVGGCHQGDTG